jgi:hypothetical protein
MHERIHRPAVGDPERAARLREIALKAAAKRRANILAGIVPAKRRRGAAVVDGVKAAVVAAVKRFIEVPIFDALPTVTECEHPVAVIQQIVRAARGEDKVVAEQPKRFYCAGCKRAGRSGNPNRHHANPPGLVGVRCEAPGCECLGFEPGAPFIEAGAARRGRADLPATVTVDGVTYKKLGNGASRVAYDLGCGKCVVKTLHMTDVGFGANAMPFQAQAEVEFYEQTPDEDRAFLVSIKARSADYSTEIVELVANVRPDDGEGAMRRFADRVGIRDLHGANVGWRNGRMVILDFGFAPGEARRNGRGI